MGPTGCGCFAFASTRPLTHDCDIASPNAYAHLGYVGREVILAARAGPYAARCNRSPIPSVVAKDAVCLGNCMPPLDVMQSAAIRLSCFDELRIKLRL